MCLAECLVHIQKIPEVGYLQRHKTLRKERNASVDRKRSAKQIPEKTCIALTWCNFSAWNRFNNKIDWNWLNCDVFFWHLYILYIYIITQPQSNPHSNTGFELRTGNLPIASVDCNWKLKVAVMPSILSVGSQRPEVLSCLEVFCRFIDDAAPKTCVQNLVSGIWWRLLLWLFILYKWKKQTVSHLPAPGRPLIQKVHGFAVP